MRLSQVLVRGVRLPCPERGRGRVFETWGLLSEAWPEWRCRIREREDDAWFWMYVSTAGITGIFLLIMLGVVPRHATLARWIIGIVAVAVFFGTMPVRKSLAIAWDYWLE